MKTIPVAVQLYTVRELCAKDFLGTLREVSKIGYRHVELAGLYGLSPKELKKALDDLGLAAVSAHVDPDKTGEVVDLCRTLGMSFVVRSFGPDKLTTTELCREAARYLNDTGARLRANGIEFCYHNHNWEFTRVDGRYPLDLIYEETDPKNLKAQLDVYWIKRGGEDPVQYIEKLGARCATLHLKDMAPDTDFAEVGSGVLDFKAITDAGRKAGVHAFIVEQDSCKRPPLESIRMSFEHLRQIGVA